MARRASEAGAGLTSFSARHQDLTPHHYWHRQLSANVPFDTFQTIYGEYDRIETKQYFATK
jgi:hypothetical protein